MAVPSHFLTGTTPAPMQRPKCRSNYIGVVLCVVDEHIYQVLKTKSACDCRSVAECERLTENAETLYFFFSQHQT